VSSKGIYSALSGAMAQSQSLDTIANNIANVNTSGFKKDRQLFNEYLTANEKMPDTIQAPKIPATTQSFYDMNGGDRAYVDAKGSYTDHSQGSLRGTNGVLDVAIEGRGFLEVATPNGVKFTRNGNLKIDSQGRLVTSEGHPVLREGAGGGDASTRAIQVGTNSNITISYSGEIYQSDEMVGRLSVVDFNNHDVLQKQGNSLYGLKPNYNAAPSPAADFKIHQGFIEMSNVNVIDEMTSLIQASRVFETNQEVIKAFDQMDQRLVNDVPRTR
jgi:flagellar basal-body rod protein FlgF